MGNPLYNRFGGNMPQMTGPFSNIGNVVNQFNQFKNTFQGNPQQKVQELMNNGQMSQAKFDSISKLAQQIGLKI